MTVHSIRLPNGEWQFDDQQRLGKPGGFGEVFRGSRDGGIVAVKQLNLSAAEAAHRELAIGSFLTGKRFQNVVEVLDAGQDALSDRYYVVMPTCGLSLQEAIDATDGGLAFELAIPIICAILSGLREVIEITHRDLKPSNVLFHNAVWKIADFGIAKFVEDSTSLETLRSNLTPAYAAPEQWLGERPSGATDIYAAGCIVHALLTGEPSTMPIDFVRLLD
jgi:eukaryotic-like serine/threonine-protein kinase